jgi:methylmalonyl-CoA mutase cobalamin-binding domain/chain
MKKMKKILKYQQKGGALMENGNKERLLQNIHEAIVSADPDTTAAYVKDAVNSGIEVLKIVDALSAGINTLGIRFERMESFLPELILGAGAMEASMEILKPEIEKLELQVGTPGKVVMANIQGDIHDIGRDIVITMMRVAGLNVYDLGHDVKADVIIDKALEYDANVIGVSSLLTTSLPYARELLKLLDARGLRDRFQVIMGGGAVTPEFCQQVGADGYGENAAVAVKLVQNLLSGGDIQ